MIQKRYQYYTSDGIKWSPWRNYTADDNELERLERDEKWQLKPKLLNEYRKV